MQVACEHCNTEYDLDDAHILERGVRITCPSCAHVFIVYPNREEEEEEVSLDQEDSPEEIAWKVHKLEHLYFAPVISKLLRKSENEG